MTWKGLVFLTLVGVPVHSFADQYAYISREEAMSARDLLSRGTTALEYCRPCGDTHYKKIVVTTVDVRHTGYENYYEVVINGKGIDLAYVFIYHNERWTNLAWAIGLEASEMPFYLRLPKEPEPDGSVSGKEIFDKDSTAKKN